VNIRFLIALAAILFSALHSDAQTNNGWDNRFFPTINSPLRVDQVFASDVISSQMVEAVNERWIVAFSTNWVNYNLAKTNNYYQRKPEVLLNLIKGAVSNLASSFVFTNALINGPTSAIPYTAISLIDSLGIPQDFYTNTPVRGLMGGGAYSAVNNYGWHGAYQCLNALILTKQDVGFLKRRQDETCDISVGFASSSGAISTNYVPPILSGSANSTFTYKKYDVTFLLDLFNKDGGYESRNIVDFGSAAFYAPPIQYATTYPKLYDENTEGYTWTLFNGGASINPYLDVNPFFSYSCSDLPNENMTEILENFSTSNIWVNTEIIYAVNAEIVETNKLVFVSNQSSYGQIPAGNSAESLVSQMTCSIGFPEGPASVISTCTGGGELAQGDGLREAVVTGETKYSHIIKWGFKYK
jgi:hypothetical protein